MTTKWKGMLLEIGKPSRFIPAGTYGKKIIINEELAQRMVKEIIGLPLLSWHSPIVDNRLVFWANLKIGTIEEASIVNDQIILVGSLETVGSISLRAEVNKLGLSFEGNDFHVHDWNEPIWTITDGELIGVAVVERPSFDSSFEIIEEG